MFMSLPASASPGAAATAAAAPASRRWRRRRPRSRPRRSPRRPAAGALRNATGRGLGLGNWENPRNYTKKNEEKTLRKRDLQILDILCENICHNRIDSWHCLISLMNFNAQFGMEHAENGGNPCCMERCLPTDECEVGWTIVPIPSSNGFGCGTPRA